MLVELTESIGFGARIALARLFHTDATPAPPPSDHEPMGGTGNDITRLERFAQYMQALTDFQRLCDTYDRMDETDIVAGILDMYAEDATTPNPDTGRTVWIECKNERIKEELEKLLKRLEIERLAFQLTRDMCKYGRHFERLYYATGRGVLEWEEVPVREVERVEKRGKLIGFRQKGKEYNYYPVGKNEPDTRDLSNPWDYAQFSLYGRSRFPNTSGTSLLHPAIRAWKQIVLSEDASMLYKLKRAPDRLRWKIDVGTMGEAEAARTVQRFRQRATKATYLDPATAKFEQQFMVMSPVDDIYIPMARDSQTECDVMTGSSNTDDMNDLRYLTTKLHMTLRVPPGYRGFEDLTGGEMRRQSRLTNQNMTYARAVRRVQMCFREGLYRLCQINLALLNPMKTEPDLDWAKPENEFSVVMEPVSYLEETERVELLTSRVNLAQTMASVGQVAAERFDAVEWQKYVMKTILRLPEKEVEKFFKSAEEVAPEEVPAEPGQEQSPEQEAVSPPARERLLEEREAAIRRDSLEIRARVGSDISIPEVKEMESLGEETKEDGEAT